MTEAIDVVIPWVDGKDPELRRRRMAAMDTVPNASADDVGGETRYSNLGELSWSVASINRFMPWVRKIFIVTDNQDPSRELELTNRNFGQPIPVEVVDHKVVFRGMEDILPVFNCNSIEAMVWRIPGLSDHYLYFNDDMFIMSPMQPEDWFDGDTLICHGHRMWLPWAKFLERFRYEHGHHAQGFKTPMIAAAEAAGENHFIYYYHSPLAQDRRLLERFFEPRRELLRATATPKFRDPSQLSPHSLCNLLAERAGLLRLVRENTNLFLKPLAEHPDYLTTRLANADKDTRFTTGCISSLDRASDAQKVQFEEWIARRLQVVARP